MTLLQLEAVELEYPARGGDAPVKAVAGVSLAIERGQVLGLAGESGCGKSSLARVAVGLTAPTAGTVAFEGEPVRALVKGTRPARETRLQMVFQDPTSALNPRRRVGEQIADALVIDAKRPGGARRDRAEIRRRVAELLVDVGLPAEAAGRFPGQFSGGQRQRIVLARALAAAPVAFVLDEPFASLDASSQAQIMNLLRQLRERDQIGMLLISHDLGVIRQTADVVAIMYLGRIVEYSTAEALWEEPLHPYTEALISAIPSVTQIGEIPNALRGEVPDPANPPAGCPFHTRCPHVFARCRVERPPLVEVAPGRQAACWLHDQKEPA